MRAVLVVENNVGRGLVKMRRLDVRNSRSGRDNGFLACRQRSGGQFPCLAGVPRELNVAVVGPHPEHPLLERAWRDADDCAVVFGVGDIESQPSAFTLFLLLRVVCRQVGAYDLPGAALVRAAVDELAAQINGRRLERGGGETGGPIVSVLDLAFGR